MSNFKAQSSNEIQMSNDKIDQKRRNFDIEPF
jgi:hypothetical protein